MVVNLAYIIKLCIWHFKRYGIELGLSLLIVIRERGREIVINNGVVVLIHYKFKRKSLTDSSSEITKQASSNKEYCLYEKPGSTDRERSLKELKFHVIKAPDGNKAVMEKGASYSS